MENSKQSDSLESDDDVIPSLTASSERSDSLESDDEILPKRDSLESDDEILSAPKVRTKLKRNRCHNFECDNRDENSKARRQRQLGSQTYVETLGKLMGCSADNETRPNTSENDRTATERLTRRKRNHHYMECGNENPKQKRLEAVESFVDKTTCKGSSSSGTKEEEEEEEEATIPTPTATDTLLQAEAKDLDDLTTVAAEATVIQFDKKTGHPALCSQSHIKDDNEDSLSHPIRGLVKISRAMMLQNNPDLFWELSQIHSIVKKKVHLSQMVPWAGIGADSTRLRSFGFLGNESLYRLDHESDVRLYAPEKQGKDALLDEQANRRAICVLHKTRERVVCDDAADRDEYLPMATKTTVNPTRVADKLCAVILGNNTNQKGKTISSNNANSNLSRNVLCSDELIAYQTNLHNGAQHLSAHLDAPLHEGFGKVIVTVAIRGSATILLIGKGGDDNSYNDDHDEDQDDDDDDERSDSTQLQEQPAWKFHLQEGEAYVLSGNARNISLHAVISDKSSGGDRESLNLRFGLHSAQEAENDIRKHWPGLW